MNTKKLKRNIKTIAYYIIVIILMIIVLFPFYWMVASSFKTQGELFALDPTWFPQEPTIENYLRVINTEGFTRYFYNSAIVSFSTTILSILIGSLAAFAFALFKFRGSRILSFSILLSQMFPISALIVPLFILISRLQLYNTYSGLIIAYTVFTLPLAVWLMTGFFDSIPKEIADAAYLDGCSYWQFYFRILLPLSAPGIAATGIFVFLTSWSEFLLALILTESPSVQTISVGLSTFIEQRGVDWGGITTAATLASLPLLILFWAVQRHFVAGMTAGAVKG